MMGLSEILSADIIDLSLQGRTKDEILHELSGLLFRSGYICDIDQFIRDIYVREAAGVTGAGNHIAIPHGKSRVVRRITIAIGRSEHDVEWESYDGEPVNLFFLFCVSDDEGFAANHMRLLAELAGKIGKDTLVEKLRDAGSPEEVISILTA